MTRSILFLFVFIAFSTAQAQLDDRVNSGHSNTSDLEVAGKREIEKFIKINDGLAGMPIVENRTPYVAAKKKFCISGDCHHLMNSFYATAGALKMSDSGGNVNFHLEGAPFRSSMKGVNFDLLIDKKNIFDAKEETIFPLCDESCYSVKIHAKGKGDAILILFIEPGGKKKPILFINASVNSEADAGPLFKMMDDYYEKKGYSLDHKEHDPKKEEAVKVMKVEDGEPTYETKPAAEVESESEE